MFEWDAWLIADVISKITIYLTSFITVGSMVFLWWVKPSDKPTIKSLLNLTLIAGVLSLIFSVTRISIQAGQLYDEGLEGLFDWEMIGIVREGPLGLSTYFRLTGIFVLLTAIPFAAFRCVGTLVGGILVATSFAMVGHATKDQLFLGPMITIHLLAVSFWLGALYPLYKLASDQNSLIDAGELAHKFGKQAAIMVSVLIMMGAAFSIFLVGSPEKLFSTSYGLLLLIKVAMVGILLALAALNKFKIVPALRQKNQIVARQLKTSIKLEFLVFLIIFAMTAILTTAVSLPDM